MKIKTFIATALLLLSSVFSFSQLISFDELDLFAKEFTKNCPQMIDADTRLNQCLAIPSEKSELTIMYDYTIVSYSKSSIINIFGSIETVKQITENSLIASSKGESFAIFRQNKMTVIYKYSDLYGVYLFSVIIDPTDYTNYY
jgi:hypothetical protein